MSGVHAFGTDSLAGRRVPLSQYKSKVLLIMNIASKCRSTPQYAGPEAVYRRPHDKGLEVLSSPCNQFGKQEPGGVDGISAFCGENYGMSFPMFGKINVNGSDVHPFYKWLTSEKPGMLGIGAIEWNFTKLLLHRDGAVYRRYALLTKPEETTDDIERLLAEPDLAWRCGCQSDELHALHMKPTSERLVDSAK